MRLKNASEPIDYRMESYELPEEIPAMRLPETVFFPRSILPLYIFESHYRQMLTEVIEGNRMLTILTRPDLGQVEHTDPEIVTLGYLKACQTYPDGTSMVLLEGISRAQVDGLVREDPYPIIAVTPIEEAPSDALELQKLRQQTLDMIETIHQSGGNISESLLEQLKEVEPPQHFVDHVTAACLQNPTDKRRILQSNNPVIRYEWLILQLQKELAYLNLLNQIKGDLTPDQIRKN